MWKEAGEDVLELSLKEAALGWQGWVLAKRRVRQEIKVALWHVVMEGHSIRGRGRKETPWVQVGCQAGFVFGAL